jgi:hypothetical protein
MRQFSHPLLSLLPSGWISGMFMPGLQQGSCVMLQLCAIPIWTRPGPWDNKGNTLVMFPEFSIAGTSTAVTIVEDPLDQSPSIRIIDPDC